MLLFYAGNIIITISPKRKNFFFSPLKLLYHIKAKKNICQLQEKIIIHVDTATLLSKITTKTIDRIVIYFDARLLFFLLVLLCINIEEKEKIILVNNIRPHPLYQIYLFLYIYVITKLSSTPSIINKLIYKNNLIKLIIDFF